VPTAAVVEVLRRDLPDVGKKRVGRNKAEKMEKRPEDGLRVRGLLIEPELRPVQAGGQSRKVNSKNTAGEHGRATCWKGASSNGVFLYPSNNAKKRRGEIAPRAINLQKNRGWGGLCQGRLRENAPRLRQS